MKLKYPAMGVQVCVCSVPIHRGILIFSVRRIVSKCISGNSEENFGEMEEVG